MGPQKRRRVSYVIPSPSPTLVPRLALPPDGAPRNGQTGPILIPLKGGGNFNDTRSNVSEVNEELPRHPQHRLGVAAYALDTSTQLPGRSSPEGILYTGGRDGMIMAWDLGMPMKRRSYRYGAFAQSGTRRLGRWEKLTRDEEDDSLYEEDDDEEDFLTSDGDVLGDVLESGGRRGSRYRAKQDDIPFEQRWELDISRVEPGQKAHWRQYTQAHTDWVNDILLCNTNQTVVSGSSDGTVKAWNPHSPSPSDPTTIGTHSDYVRCLAQCYEKRWVASGSFDRSIKLWDIAQPREDPLLTLLPPDSAGPKSSVYALATDPMGHVVASGGPERVIRTWDPRSGKRIGKLVGHTDNIRVILVSDDSRYLLTGSADASIKLWSILSPQRCIYTFTHHTESVWSLFSSHPSLEVFYSGDRSGIVCRVDVEECDRVAEGECVVLCKDTGDPQMAMSEGISKILTMDDYYMWTATGSSDITRWRIPQSRTVRSMTGDFAMTSPVSDTYSPVPIRNEPSPISNPHSPVYFEEPTKRKTRGQSMTPSITASFMSSSTSLNGNGENTLRGIPYESLVKLTSPNAPHISFNSSSRGREAEVSTLYSAVSVRSVPQQYQDRQHPTGPQPGHQHTVSLGQVSILTPGSRRDTLSLPLPDAGTHAMPNARLQYEERDVAPDAVQLIKEPDLVISGAHGLVRVLIMNDRIHALTVDTAGVVAVWDIVRAQCLGRYSREDVYTANNAASKSITSGDVERLSPRHALELVRERIEGEAVVNAWASADTRIGELTIHILDRWFESEVFADEAGYGSERVFSDDHRLNLGKWVLRNLFYSFIREEQRDIARHSHDYLPSSYKGTKGNGSNHPRAASDPVSHSRVVPPVPALLENLAGQNNKPLSPITQSPTEPSNNDLPTTPRPSYSSTNSHTVNRSNEDETTTSSGPPASGTGAGAATPMTNATPTPVSSPDYFSIRRRPSTGHSTSEARAAEDDFGGWGRPGSSRSTGSQDHGSSAPSTPGGFMGRLKSLGKSSRRVATEAETTVTGQHKNDSGESAGVNASTSPKSLVQHLKSQSITPPSNNDAPHINLPLETTIVVSEDASSSGSGSGWCPVYRGTLSSMSADLHRLEELLPDWLLEFLLANKAPSVNIVKISFALLPIQIPQEKQEEYGETLPELHNTAQSKLSASRFLRVKKLVHHVQDKLDKSSQSKPVSPRSSSDTMHVNIASQRASPTQDGSSTTNHHNQSMSTHSSHFASPPTSRASTPRLSSTSVHGHSHGHGQGGLPRAEDVYEILCNDQVLPLEMTLAAVRQFVWRQSGELVMHYRRKSRRVS